MVVYVQVCITKTICNCCKASYFIFLIEFRFPVLFHVWFFPAGIFIFIIFPVTWRSCRDFVFEQLWIRDGSEGYPSDLRSWSALNDFLPFALGTLQGGVLSQTLFNVLIHKDLSNPDLHTGDAVLSYADHICQHLTGETLSFPWLVHASATLCSLVNNTAKTLIHDDHSRNENHSPVLHDDVINLCDSYIYQGTDTGVLNDPEAHVLGSKTRLLDRLAPVSALTGKVIDVSVKITRSLYLFNVWSVITYYCIQLSMGDPQYSVPLMLSKTRPWV